MEDPTYRRVKHDLQLNAWVLAFRRGGDAFVSREGEVDIEPPREAKPIQPLMLPGSSASAERLIDERPRLIRPDAIIEI